jgi:ferredoxin
VEQVVLGARPCDARAVAALDHVFNWDFQDALYNRRRELTTIVTLACRSHDAHCFCTTVGSGPADPCGSDAMLFDSGDGQYELQLLTEKGRRLFAGTATDAAASSAAPPASASQNAPPDRFDLDALGKFLAEGFERPEWAEAALRCMGCGACAFTCPTCHCFDMVDEGNPRGGSRVRNWDACQFALFTAHASGHNPRNNQAQRQRQRLLHKFQIYPEKFGELLCTGCGNCSRNCPAGLGIRGVIEEITAKKKADGK